MNKRLPKKTGEWINRNQAISFTFEGELYKAFEGDTVTSALWASGEQILGRSFKYHRPRGILSLANHDINVMVTDGMDTHIRADVVKVKQGMQLSVVNTRGGLKQDKTRFIEWLAPFLPVGFYYKAFHKPRKLFPFWEKIIRNIAGLGKINVHYPREVKAKLNTHCDVLVIGAGLSGISAAVEVASQGLHVILVDENAQIGGSLSYSQSGSMHLSAVQTQLNAQANIRLITGAYAGGYYTDHLVPVITEHGIEKVRARAVIIATGVFEQPPVFRNNDLPGVMLGSAAQRLIYRYAVKPFSNGVVFTANDYGYEVARDLMANGIKVSALLDLRAKASNALRVTLQETGVEVYQGVCIYEALASTDGFGVRGILIADYDEVTKTANSQSLKEIACDGIAMCAGFAPAAALLYQAGTAMRFDDAIQQFVPERLPAGVFAAGKVNGIFEIDQRINDGKRAAQLALNYLGKLVEVLSVPAHQGNSPSHPYPMVPHPKGKNFIDFDEDLQLQDFFNAAQEGFDNIELMKRFTTVGMGPSQGKHSNMNAIRVLAHIRQLPVQKVGTTTARPFFHPTPIGHLAGRSFHPQRLTPVHTWHQQTGAEFVAVGAWQRAAYYPKTGETKQQTIAREVRTVHTQAGIIDVSTLGKIEVHGTDAALFLERFYTGTFANQKVGHIRYGLALDETGVMMDDGLVGRLAEDKFYLTTSTSNVALVYREMQRWQQQWQLNIVLINVTGAFGAINLAGNKASRILAKLASIDCSAEALPLGTIREIELNQVAIKLIRVGFVSDSAYEIHLRASQTLSLWESLIDAGEAEGLIPFGTEAQRLMRLEMGHSIVGHDTDGLTNPFEAGVEFALTMEKPFFVGQRSLKIIQKKTLAKKLIPFVLEKDSDTDIPQECNLVIDNAEIAGRVTSIAYSTMLERTIGLAYVTPNLAALGKDFYIRTDLGTLVRAQVTTTPFKAVHVNTAED